MNNRRVLKLLGDNRSDQPYQGRFGLVPGATLAGGSWPIPLVNLQDPELGLIARSQSLDLDHARFSVQFTREQSFRGLILCNTNATVDAQIRATGYYDVAGTDRSFDITFDAYPAVGFTEEADWDLDNSWDGKPLPADLEGFTQNAFTVLDDERYAVRIDFEVRDPDNPDGFFQAGRLLCANGWQPATNYVLGGSLSLETDTVVEKSMSGAEFFDVREPYRLYNIGFQNLREQEALDKGFELIRRAGVHGEIFVVDDFDPVNLHRLSFLARPRRLTSWERAQPKRANLSLELKERLP